MKKGFTLVEVLAVIAIMGILLFVVTPTVTSVLSKNKDKMYDAQVTKIINATKSYSARYNQDLVWENGLATVYLYQLQDKSLISENLKNPKTNKVYNPATTNVKITKTENRYTYVFEGFEL